jgi:CheY-like chemotaxis protein
MKSASKTPEMGSMPEDTRKLRLLVAEDYPINVLMIKAFLESTSYVVDYANDGGEAVERFSRAPYDIVFMDLEMPVMNGYDASMAIRKIEREKGLERTPIVALTAHTSEQVTKADHEMLFDEYLAKPLDRRLILSTISALMKGREPKLQGASDPLVRTSRDMEPRMDAFMKAARNFCKLVSESLLKDDMKPILKQSHNMKGAGGSYGFDRLSEIAREIEAAATRGDKLAIAEQLSFFEEYIDRVKIEYE